MISMLWKGKPVWRALGEIGLEQVERVIKNNSLEDHEEMGLGKKRNEVKGGFYFCLFKMEVVRELLPPGRTIL